MLTQIIIIITTMSMTCQCHDRMSTSATFGRVNKSQLASIIFRPNTGDTQEEENKDKYKYQQVNGFKEASLYNLHKIKKTFKLDEDIKRDEELPNGDEARIADEDRSKYSGESGKGKYNEKRSVGESVWNGDKSVSADWATFAETAEGAKKTEITDNLQADGVNSNVGAAFAHNGPKLDEQESPKHARVKRWEEPEVIADYCEGKQVLHLINNVFECADDKGGPYIIDLGNRDSFGGEKCASDMKEYWFHGKLVCRLLKRRKG